MKEKNNVFFKAKKDTIYKMYRLFDKNIVKFLHENRKNKDEVN